MRKTDQSPWTGTPQNCSDSSQRVSIMMNHREGKGRGMDLYHNRKFGHPDTLSRYGPSPENAPEDRGADGRTVRRRQLAACARGTYTGHKRTQDSPRPRLQEREDLPSERGHAGFGLSSEGNRGVTRSSEDPQPGRLHYPYPCGSRS